MTESKRVYIIGSRGCGKTSVGSGLAEQLGWNFIDTDELLCSTAERTVRQIVEDEGWDTFRDYESQALVTASKTALSVIATGGGMVLREQNCSFMREHGLVVFLDVPAEELGRRLGADPLDAQRPSLTGKNMVDEVREVLAQRMPLYTKCAHVRVDGSQSVRKIIDNIVELLETKSDS